MERWRGAERHGDTKWRGEAAEQEVLHSRVADKNQERYLGSKGSQAQARSPSPGFQHQTGKSPKLLAVKTSGVWGSRRNSRILRRLLLKGPQRS